MDVEEIIQVIVDNGRIEDMRTLSDMLEDTLEELQNYDKECYDKYMMELYKMAYGNTLNKQMAEEIVANMRPYAQRWSMQETQEIQERYGINNVRAVDFYVVMNSAFNDYRNLFDDNTDMYVKFTMDFINDEDAKEGKVFKYFMPE
jgi:hypothetical protein